MRSRLLFVVLSVTLSIPSAAAAQTAPPPDTRQAAVQAAPASSPPSTAPDSPEIRTLGSVFKGLKGDFGRLATRQSLVILGTGGILAAAVGPSDHSTSLAFQRSRSVDEALDPGSVGGGGFIQLGAAFGTFALGSAIHKPAAQNLGADLLEAQLVAGVITQGLKFAVQRTRPNGGNYSFPSGHSSASFVTADVLQQHFGWKIGIPAYIGASYVAASRIAEDKHYMSDVIFGAAVGIASARTLSFTRGGRRVQITPVATPGGAGIFLTAVPVR